MGPSPSIGDLVSATRYCLIRDADTAHATDSTRQPVRLLNSTSS
jgi:hypothetical protein